MKYVGCYKSISLRQFLVLFGILLVICLAGSVQAQYDQFGETDVVYIDSVSAGPGQDIPVHVILRNDEILSGISVPILYDSSLLTIKAIDFSGSRVQHLENQIISPADITTSDGHFLVSVFKYAGDGLAPGEGPVFTVIFTVKATALVGQVALVDSLFFPPGGTLVLVEDSSGGGITPLFSPGKVVVRGENHPPVLTSIPDQQVLEGEPLVVELTASDPDNDAVTLAATSKPTGAEFVDHGDGTATLTWTPGFVGPYSADGSPFSLVFWAGDGDLSVEKTVAVEVINKNRAPVVDVPDGVVITAGEEVSFAASAEDPDFDAVQWSFDGVPAGSTINGDNPVEVSWQSTVTDSGSTVVAVIATDPHGTADTGYVVVQVNPASIYGLQLDAIDVSLGESTDFNINLKNQLPVGSFNLLINYDVTALNISSLTNDGTRASDFEYFNYVLNEADIPGNVRIQANASLSGTPGAALPVGDGSIARFRFRAASNLAYAGLQIPVRFVFLDGFARNDNTLTGADGNKIGQQEIEYTDGSVYFNDVGQIRLGDINLNGLTYEVADVVYFTNFMMNPVLYPFSILQYANSDVNRDGLAATVADLVKLINVVVSGGARSPLATGGEDLAASIQSRQINDRLSIDCESDFAVGGALITIATQSTIEPGSITVAQNGMTVTQFQDGNGLRVLIYSMEGASIPAGSNEILAIDGINDFTIEAVDLASSDGRYVPVDPGSKPVNLPGEYVLHQNYPNPFNPETRIAFDLPESGRVELALYNVLGRRITTLANGIFTAGLHEVTWDGRDEKGASVSSGVYLYRLETPLGSISRKMILLK